MNLKVYRQKTKYDLSKRTKAENFTYLNVVCCKEGQTVIVGDSITELFNMELFCDYSRQSGLDVYNRGISGDTADRLLERFDDNVIMIKPKNIVLHIGTNDLTAGADEWYVADKVEKIVEKIQNSLEDCRIFIQSVYPVEYKNTYKNEQIVVLNNMLKRLADRKNITFIDMTALLSDDCGGFNTAYTYDGLHPNALGFKIISNQIIKNLTR